MVKVKLSFDVEANASLDASSVEEALGRVSAGLVPVSLESLGERLALKLRGCTTPDGVDHDLSREHVRSSFPVMMAHANGRPLLTAQIGERLASKLRRQLARTEEVAVEASARADARGAALRKISSACDAADRASSLEEAREHIGEIARLARRGLSEPAVERRIRAAAAVEALVSSPPGNYADGGLGGPGGNEAHDVPDRELVPSPIPPAPRRQRRVVHMPG